MNLKDLAKLDEMLVQLQKENMSQYEENCVSSIKSLVDDLIEERKSELIAA